MNTKDTPMDYKEFEGATPGPWEPDDSDYRQYVFGPDGEMICEMRGWGYLTGNRRKLSEAEAMVIQDKNCLLTAAAPDLLKENKELKLELQKQKELNAELVKIKNLVEDLIEVPHFRNQWETTTEAFESLIKKSSEI